MTNSRGLRNNNPGNIRLSGTRYKGEIVPSQDTQFKQFEDMAWGYRAMFVLLHTYRIKHGLDTIGKTIERYAPSIENHTDTYIASVCRQTGIDSSQIIDTLSPTVMKPIIAAMSRVENGMEADIKEVDKGWELFMKFKP